MKPKMNKPIDIDKRFTDFSRGINFPTLFKATIGKEMSGLQNADFEDGIIKKRKGFRTFKGMVKILKDLNIKYKKMKLSGDFTIRLPIRGSI